MKIEVKRTALKDTYTIGKMSIDGVYVADTLEDKVRDLNKDGDLDDAGETKVYGETAIPYGTYKVVLSYSNRFKRVLPEILGVKGFEGIRIHSGSASKDTSGCILVGINSIKGGLTNSKMMYNKLFAILNKAYTSGEKITIQIKWIL